MFASAVLAENKKQHVLQHGLKLSPSLLTSTITDRILIVHSGDAASYAFLEQSFRSRLSQYFDDQPHRFLSVKSINLSSIDQLEKIITDNKKEQNKSHNNLNLIVTIGARAAFDVLRRFPVSPVLSVFIPKQTYHVILDEVAYLENQQMDKSISDSVAGKKYAIYLNQPDERLVLLAKTVAQLSKRHAKGSPINVGLFTGHTTKQAQAIKVKNTQCEINQGSTGYAKVFDAKGDINGVGTRVAKSEISNRQLMTGVRLHKSNITSRYLKRALKKSDVIIVTPQLVKQSPNAIKWMVYMAYQRKVPVIGYSKAFSDAGAIASVYSTPEDIGRQGAEWFLQHHEQLAETNRGKENVTEQNGNNRLENLRDLIVYHSAYPRYFQVSVNNNVAKTLGYNQINALDLQQSLMAFSLNCQDNYQPILINKNNQKLTRR